MANFKHFDEMTCAHIETVLKKFSNQELVQLFINTEETFCYVKCNQRSLGVLEEVRSRHSCSKELEEKNVFPTNHG